jgi:hypothetical protein
LQLTLHISVRISYNILKIQASHFSQSAAASCDYNRHIS